MPQQDFRLISLQPSWKENLKCQGTAHLFFKYTSRKDWTIEIILLYGCFRAYPKTAFAFVKGFRYIRKIAIFTNQGSIGICFTAYIPYVKLFMKIKDVNCMTSFQLWTTSFCTASVSKCYEWILSDICPIGLFYHWPFDTANLDHCFVIL